MQYYVYLFVLLLGVVTGLPQHYNNNNSPQQQEQLLQQLPYVNVLADAPCPTHPTPLNKLPTTLPPILKDAFSEVQFQFAKMLNESGVAGVTGAILYDNEIVHSFGIGMSRHYTTTTQLCLNALNTTTLHHTTPHHKDSPIQFAKMLNESVLLVWLVLFCMIKK